MEDNKKQEIWSVGICIRRLLNERKTLSLKEVAAFLGTSPNNLSKILKKDDIDTFLIRKLSKFLKINIFSVLSDLQGKELQLQSTPSTCVQVWAEITDKDIIKYFLPEFLKEHKVRITAEEAFRIFVEVTIALNSLSGVQLENICSHCPCNGKKQI